MKEKTLEEYAILLVEITINNHNKNLLGREKMSVFIKNNLNIDITEKEYNTILHLYCRLLAKAGYEIKKDINCFDIINYNSDEYQIYCKSIFIKT